MVSTAVRFLIGSLILLAVGYGFYSFTRACKTEAPELPRLRERLSFLRQRLSESHPEVQRQVKLIAELERDPSSLLGRWFQTNSIAIWEFRDDSSVFICSRKTGTSSGKYAAITRDVVRLNFGNTNTHTGLVYRKVANGHLTLVDGTGNRTVFDWRE